MRKAQRRGEAAFKARSGGAATSPQGSAAATMSALRNSPRRKPPKLPHKLKMTSVKKQPQNLRSSLEASCSHFQYGRA